MSPVIDFDDEVQRRIDTAVDAALGQHLVDSPHGTLTEDRVREIVAEIIDRPPPTEPDGRRLPADRLIMEIDPSDPTTFGPGMTRGQRWAAGDMIQARERQSFIAPRLPPEHRAGYGLSMDDRGNIYSWPMANGRTHRYGVFDDAAGRWFTLASQYRTDDGYHPSANRWYNLVDGRPVEVLPYRGWRINTAIDRRPGHSDAVTFDSAKSGLSAIGADTPIGPDAPVVTYGLSFRVAPWMHGAHSIAGFTSLHEPGSRYSGPIASTVHRGKIRWWSKKSVVTHAIDYDADNRFEDVVIGDVSLPPPGTVVDLIIRKRPDRTGRASLLQVLWVNPAGSIIGLLDKRDPYGYLFTDPDKNERFYPILEIHPWHEWNTPSSGRRPVWNWDPTTTDGPCCYLDVRRFFVGTDLTPDEAAADLVYFRSRP